MRLRVPALPAALAACLVVAAPASAQWYVAGALGVSHAPPSTVVIDQPSNDTHLEFDRVPWAAKPFYMPPYYFYRVGRWFGEQRQWGLEVEIIHPKMYGDTSASVPIRGRIAGKAIDETAPISRYIQRYAMSHGMNLAFGNLVFRRPISAGGGAVAFTARGGAGISFPHTEVTMDGRAVDQYEFGGFAANGAAGLEWRLARRLGALVEYKLAYARPRVDVPDGEGRTTALIHQLAFGLSFAIR
jgi:lipid A oxidase